MAMSNVQGEFILAEGEEFIQCPYNVAHIVTNARLIVHLNKCRAAYKKDLEAQGKKCEMKQCRYNWLHQCPKPEIRHHELRCPDQYNVVESIRYHQSDKFKQSLEEDRQRRERDNASSDSKHHKHKSHKHSRDRDRHSGSDHGHSSSRRSLHKDDDDGDEDEYDYRKKHSKKHKHKEKDRERDVIERDGGSVGSGGSGGRDRDRDIKYEPPRPSSYNRGGYHQHRQPPSSSSYGHHQGVRRDSRDQNQKYQQYQPPPPKTMAIGDNPWGEEAEDWEAEAQGYEPGYNPEVKLQNEQVLYQPRGMSKSERKTFRLEQRQKASGIKGEPMSGDDDDDNEVDVKPFSKLEVKEEMKPIVADIKIKDEKPDVKHLIPPPPVQFKSDTIKFNGEKEDGECSEEEEFYGEDPFA